jgi:hypothetical protein
VTIFCSVSCDLPALAESVRATLAKTPADQGGVVTIVGCTTSGQLTGTGVTDGSVVISAWGGSGFQVRTRVATEATRRLRETGVEVAGGVAELDRPYKALLLLCDGLSGSQHEIVRGAYTVLGAAVPMVGGAAGDDLTFQGTYQFYGDLSGVRVLADSVIGVAIGSTAPLGIGIAHGWRRIGHSMIVTSSQEGRVYQFDGVPALDAYLRQIGADEAVAADEVAFQELSLQHPLGLSRRSGEDIRVIQSRDLTERSIDCLADVPQGALAWLMESDDEALIAGADESCRQALSMLDGAPPIGVLAFDCAARKLKLGTDGVKREVAEMAERLADIPFAGFYTNGEIARVRGARGMHHLTLVTLAIA